MKRIIHTLSEKWPEYLLEILVLVIGIYGAFELDNWNENRRSRQTEKIILLNLKQEILANKAELEITTQRHAYSRECAFELLKYFGKDVSYLSSKKLDALLAQAETVWTFEARYGYIQSTISSGNINYLSNDSLKSLLTIFNSQVVDATQEVDYVVDLVHHRLWPITDGTINWSNRNIAYGFEGFSEGSYKSDYASFFQNHEIEDILSNIAGWHINIQQEEEDLMDYFNRLVILLDRELSTF